MVKQRVATNDAEVTKMQIPYDRVIDHLDLVSDAAVYVEQSVGAAAYGGLFLKMTRHIVRGSHLT